MLTALLVFAVTYVLIAARRFSLLHIGRPAGALLGAVGMVLLGVLTPKEAFACVDLPTIGLLFGMMVLTGYLREAGLFSAVVWRTLDRKWSPRAVLGGVVWLSGLASAFLVNDTVCLMMTPLLCVLTEAAGLDPLPYLLALATSANIGSVATLAGNPQNMLIGMASGIPYREYLLVMAPVAALCLGLNHWLLLSVFGKRLRSGARAEVSGGAPRVKRAIAARSLLVLAGVVVAWLLGADLAFTAVCGAALLILINRISPSKVFRELDWPLLLFFAALFVVVGGVERAGVVAALRAWLPAGGGAAGIAGFTVVSVAASNLFSNVPFVLVAAKWVQGLPAPRLHWYLLALTSTFAGNLTLVGSMANLIVAELSGGLRVMGFRQYFRYGALVTLATTVAGVLYLVLVFALWPR
ncbi:MAG: SLC13 family permease [Acidobacteriota bacterium]